MTVKNPQLSTALFLDIAEKDITRTLSSSKDWVVVRVFEYGTIEEISEIINYYGRDTVKLILESAGALKPVTKAMARLFLDLNLK